MRKIKAIVFYLVSLLVCQTSEASNFLISAQLGYTGQVKKDLQRGVDVNEKGYASSSRSEHGGTALWAAVVIGSLELVKILIEYNADVNLASDDNMSTPLYEACLAGHETIAALLLENGAKVNSRNGPKDTPLMAAASSGSPTLVTLLLQHGADANLKNDLDLSALMLAAREGRVEAFKILMPLTQSVLVKNNRGWTVRVLARGNEEMLALLAVREPRDALKAELEDLKHYFTRSELVDLLKTQEHPTDPIPST